MFRSILKRGLLLSVYITSFILYLPECIQAQSISQDESIRLANILSNSKADTAQINILLKLAKYHIFKAEEKKQDLDSASDLIKKAENINTQIHSKWASGYILLVNSYLLKETDENEKAKESVRRSIDFLKSETDMSLTGEAWFEYSGYFDIYDSEALASRVKLVDSAVLYFKKGGNLKKVGESLHMLGDLQQINGMHFIALQKLRQALEVYASIDHEPVQGIYSLMGRIYNRQRDYKQALNYQLLALKTAEKVGDNSIQMCMINTGIGQTLTHLGEIEKALEYHQKAFDVAESFKDVNSIYIATTNIANTWNTLKKPHKALAILNKLLKDYKKPEAVFVDLEIARAYIGSYTILKDYAKAEPYVQLLLKDVATLDMNDYSNLYAYAEVVKFYVNSGQYNLATKYLHKHTALAEKIEDLLQMGNSQKLWFMLDTARHDFQSATQHLLIYKKLNDSLFNETKSGQISELQIQYEIEKKEKDILVKGQDIQLLTKQSQLQQSQISNERLARNAIIIGAALLLLILLLLYNRFVHNKKNNLLVTFKNEQLQHLLVEKEWLLKEIHHRVKNNLQIVMSLLNSQSAYIDNKAALTAIHDSQHRVHAMSLIHQKLYNTENASSIGMSVYIRELANYLADSFDAGQRIRFAFDIEPLEMDVSQAVPLGLILNEAITNAMKYAFPDEASGLISIKLKSTDPNHYLLVVSDNGIGIASHLEKKKPGSLGMNLMTGLSEDLNGHFTIENDNGTIVKISFVVEQVIKMAETQAPALAYNY